MDEEKEKALQKAEEDAKNKADAIEAEKARSEEDQKRIDEGVAELKKQNEEKNKILDREEKLQDRKEALQALGGGSPGGTESKSKFTEEEIASRKRIKAVADSGGSAWGKKYE